MVGRPGGILYSHASGERERLSNLPQSRTLLVLQPECSRLRRAVQDGTGSAMRANPGRKGLHGHQVLIKIFFY